MVERLGVGNRDENWIDPERIRAEYIRDNVFPNFYPELEARIGQTIAFGLASGNYSDSISDSPFVNIPPATYYPTRLVAINTVTGQDAISLVIDPIEISLNGVLFEIADTSLKFIPKKQTDDLTRLRPSEFTCEAVIWIRRSEESEDSFRGSQFEIPIEVI